MDASIKRVVFLGKTGSGKSSLANTIFGENWFEINKTSMSGTSECQAETKSVHGRSITLIDTPGFFDTRVSEKDLKPEILKCVTECAPGIHAFFIVVRVDKFTEEEMAVITKIKEYFSEKTFSHSIVVFTHGDQLEEGQNIGDFVRKDRNLRDLVKKCGGRCHVIDNKYWKEKQVDEYRSNNFQVKEILHTLDKMVTEHNGGFYTNEILKVVEEVVKRKRETIRQSPGNMSEKNINKKAKNDSLKELLIIFAGTATGALLGLLFGALTMIRADSQIQKATNGTGGQMSFTILAASAAVGALIGGGTGYVATNQAETPQDAAKMAAKAVKDIYCSVKDETTEAIVGLSQLTLKK